MTEWKLLIGTRELFGTYDDITALHEQLTATGIECYMYSRVGEFAEWRYVA